VGRWAEPRSPVGRLAEPSSERKIAGDPVRAVSLGVILIIADLVRYVEIDEYRTTHGQCQARNIDECCEFIPENVAKGDLGSYVS